MNFGEKLRHLRAERNLTQPELAEAIGIEQSYLSKLENGKSLPSNDVFNRLLDVFDLDIAALVGDLDQSSGQKLRQIPDVAAYFDQQRRELIVNRKRWLLASALLMSFGFALIYAGSAHLFFPNAVYEYVSKGVVLNGESKEIFSNPGGFAPMSAGHEERIRFIDSINARRNEDFVQHSAFKGDMYNVQVDGGSRTYTLRGQTEIDPWQSKLVVFFGILLSVFGLTGIALERKLSRH